MHTYEDINSPVSLLIFVQASTTLHVAADGQSLDFICPPPSTVRMKKFILLAKLERNTDLEAYTAELEL